MELLSNHDLEYYAKLLKIKLNAVKSKNDISIKPEEGSYIINMEDMQDGNGTHWVCLIIHKNVAIYYDSYGLPPDNDTIQFVYKFNKKSALIYSIDQIQTLKSTLCGWYCLFFLYYITVLNKQSMKYRLLLNKHNAIFSLKNRHLNDRILQACLKNSPLVII